VADASPGSADKDRARVLGALRRYRVMAYTVGIALLVLVFVGIPLQLAHHPEVVHVVGVIHGVLYIVYLLAAVDLANHDRWSFGRIVALVTAGFLPFLAFVVERWMTRQVLGTSGDHLGTG
jgi:integral membrane protein